MRGLQPSLDCEHPEGRDLALSPVAVSGDRPEEGAHEIRIINEDHLLGTAQVLGRPWPGSYKNRESRGPRGNVGQWGARCGVPGW